MSGTSQSSPSEQNDFLLNKLTSFSTVAPQPLKAPALSPADQNATYNRVRIAGKVVPAMIISGEPRVPLVLVKKFCLPEFEKNKEKSDDAAYSELLHDLNIHIHAATVDQFSQLRRVDGELNLEQEKAVCMELITMTDAERVLGLMREESNELPELNRTSGLANVYDQIPVSHWISGDEPIKGILYPARKGGRCIQCEECKKYFTPEHFIVHSHSENLENMRIVHWGLCTDNWRKMIVLSPDAMADIMLSHALEQFMLDDTTSAKKRSATDDEEDVPLKRPRTSSFVPPFQASAELAAILEGASQLPKFATDLLVSGDDYFFLRNNEAKFREKATKEAMKEEYSIGCSGKGFNGLLSIQEKARQTLRCQLPYFPDPQSFPKKPLPSDGTSTLMEISERIKVLESKTGETENRRELDDIRKKLHLFAYQNQQQDAIYAMLLGSYTMINEMWRYYVDPTQPSPVPYGADYEEFAKSFAALDHMNLLGGSSNMIKGVQTVNVPPGPSSSVSQKSPHAVANGLGLAAMMRRLQTAGVSPSFLAPQNNLLNLLSPDPAVINMVNNMQGYQQSMPSGKVMNSLLQPPTGPQLPTTPAGLLSPKQILNHHEQDSANFQFLRTHLASFHA